tara:strand:- start:181 stop:942 length:762 start_codon:yes stop_codon:yes gene_type:complete
MDACEVTTNVHRALQQSASVLKVVRSTMRNRTSIHFMPETTAFASLFGFQKIAQQVSCAPKTFIGSIDGQIVLSINTAYDPPDELNASKKKKRGRDTRDAAKDDADRAVAKVERCGADAGKVSQATFNAARGVLTDVLNIRGVGNESVIESWAVSLRKPGSWGATPNEQGAPSIVIGFRFAAGVPIALGKLCTSVRVCRDGLVTTSVERVNTDFDLPLSDQGSAAQASGQKSMLLLASIPHLEDQPKDPPKDP